MGAGVVEQVDRAHILDVAQHVEECLLLVLHGQYPGGEGGQREVLAEGVV